MTSCPSLLDTLGFLKFPDSTLINFSEDGTSDILESLKSRSDDPVPIVSDNSLSDVNMTNVSDNKNNVTNISDNKSNVTNISDSKSNVTNISDSDNINTFSESEEIIDTKPTSQSGSGTSSFYRGKKKSKN